MPRRPKPPPDALTCASQTQVAEPCVSESGSTATARETAQAHADEALRALVELVRNASSEHVRVAAANAILDRALGKPLPGAKAAAEEDDEPSGPLVVRWLDP